MTTNKVKQFLSERQYKQFKKNVMNDMDIYTDEQFNDALQDILAYPPCAIAIAFPWDKAPEGHEIWAKRSEEYKRWIETCG